MNVPAFHRALVARVDAFERAVRARRAADVACRAGCSACCRTQLTVCDVEAALVREGIAALDAASRARIAARGAAPDPDRCAFLEDDGRCAIYEVRPLVCRTHGLPLRYPDGMIPAEAVLARAAGDPVTWCPLNFTARGPAAQDVLDAARLDAMLAVSNRAAGGDPERRTALAALARQAGTSVANAGPDGRDGHDER